MGKKFEILDNFAHKIGNVELEFGSGYEHTESIVGLV